jgi:hypothetical protein
MWRQLREDITTPYYLQQKVIPIDYLLRYMDEVEAKERWNMEHKKAPIPRCPPNPY